MNSNKYQEACDDMENHKSYDDVEKQCHEGRDCGDMENHHESGDCGDVESHHEGGNLGDIGNRQGGEWGDMENIEGGNLGDMENHEGGEWSDMENIEGGDWGDVDNYENEDWSDVENSEGGNWDEGGDWDADLDDREEEDGWRHRYASFEQTYRCYSVSSKKKSDLVKGDKVILPESALERLVGLGIEYPMIFEISKHCSNNKISHCGVLEFTAEEGEIYLPNWMMENLHVEEGDLLMIKNAYLLDGSYVKMQPHTTDFLDLSNPKAILETTLRNYTCLTTGDTIMILYNNKKFYMDILETKPSPAVLIVETDCEIDFAPPLDYKEADKPPVSSTSTILPDTSKVTAPKFGPFTGSSRRLDGKPAGQTKSGLLQEEDTGRSNGLNKRCSGKLIFSFNEYQKSFSEERKKEEVPKQKAGGEEEEVKFKAFSGKKYSLRG